MTLEIIIWLKMGYDNTQIGIIIHKQALYYAWTWHYFGLSDGWGEPCIMDVRIVIDILQDRTNIAQNLQNHTKFGKNA